MRCTCVLWCVGGGEVVVGGNWTWDIELRDIELVMYPVGDLVLRFLAQVLFLKTQAVLHSVECRVDGAKRHEVNFA